MRFWYTFSCFTNEYIQCMILIQFNRHFISLNRKHANIQNPYLPSTSLISYKSSTFSSLKHAMMLLLPLFSVESVITMSTAALFLIWSLECSVWKRGIFFLLVYLNRFVISCIITFHQTMKSWSWHIRVFLQLRAFLSSRSEILDLCSNLSYDAW